jgi:hypothetical protein
MQGRAGRAKAGRGKGKGHKELRMTYKVTSVNVPRTCLVARRDQEDEEEETGQRAPFESRPCGEGFLIFSRLLLVCCFLQVTAGPEAGNEMSRLSCAVLFRSSG